MFSKNYIFINLVFSVLMLFGAQAQAHNVWQAKVWYSGSIHPVTISESALRLCNRELSDARSNPPPGNTVLRSTSCALSVHLHGTIPDIGDSIRPIQPPILWPRPWPRPWPWPCLSCPPFDFQDNILQRFNPAQSEKVKSLIDKYNIDAYSEDIINLQQQYDLEEFEKELNNLQQNIDQDSIKTKQLK